ncbi:MAG TPA: hypothetical protein VHV78_15760 [Gemmatimonadaceae bacterium]|jgi:hypothetical protein|nr:hypothetical protein [Gemmatimonadaceae bacterium]
MTDADTGRSPSAPQDNDPSSPKRQAWIPPRLEELPPLVQLTLTSGASFGGTGGPGGVSFP